MLLRSASVPGDGDALFKGSAIVANASTLRRTSNVVIAMPESGFRTRRDRPKGFRRADLETPATRGVLFRMRHAHPGEVVGVPRRLIIKVGTLDDPSVSPARRW